MARIDGTRSLTVFTCRIYKVGWKGFVASHPFDGEAVKWMGHGRFVAGASAGAIERLCLEARAYLVGSARPLTIQLARQSSAPGMGSTSNSNMPMLKLKAPN